MDTSLSSEVNFSLSTDMAACFGTGATSLSTCRATVSAQVELVSQHRWSYYLSKGGVTISAQVELLHGLSTGGASISAQVELLSQNRWSYYLSTGGATAWS